MQGVAHHHILEYSPLLTDTIPPMDFVEEDTAIANVLDGPVVAGARKEREGKVSGNSDGTGCRRGGVRRVGRVEDSMIVEQSEEGRVVELAETAEEGAVGDDVVEGDAADGGTDEVGWRGQAKEDVR